MLQNSLPKFVEIIEVGPRDGLQRENKRISIEEKIALIESLIDAGLRRIQVTSFVHPKLVPQMADAEELVGHLPEHPDVIYSALALNLKGVERAGNCGIKMIDISVSASDPHSIKNANRTVQEALTEFKQMYELAHEYNMMVRGGIQCAFGYEKPGDVNQETVIEIAKHHLELGVDELAIADSAGFANPEQMIEMMGSILDLINQEPVILHLHDTRGMGITNMYAALKVGIRHFDTSFGGMGGCPFITWATGNIATEDSVYMLHQLGIETGIDLEKLSHISRHFETLLGKLTLPGKLYQFYAPKN